MGITLVRPWLGAAWVLYDLAGPARPQTVERQAVTYTVDGRQRNGDFYPPAGRYDTGLVIVPGAAVAGKDDPAMIRFAHVLAGAGFAVLIPDIADARALRVSPEDAIDVADAARWLGEREKRVGIAAVSYGVGPAILAALRLKDRVAFVLGIGGYYDAEAVIGFFTTGWYFEDGRWTRRVPNAYGRWAFARSNAVRLFDSGDRAMLEAMASRRMAAPEASLDDLVRRLTPTARPIYELLVNPDIGHVSALIEALPAGIQDDIHALDLSRHDLRGLTAQLILVHGRDDAIIPAGESRKLAAAVPRASLFVADDLWHTTWSPRHLDGIVTLLGAVRILLDEREGSHSSETVWRG